MRAGRSGTILGWLAREVAYLLDSRGISLAKSRTNKVFVVAELIYRTVTGNEPTATLADKCKKAADLIRKMNSPEARIWPEDAD